MLGLGGNRLSVTNRGPSATAGKWQTFRNGFSNHLISPGLGVMFPNLEYQNKTFLSLKGSEYDIINGHETEPNLNLNFDTSKWLTIAIWTRFHGLSEVYDEPAGPGYTADQYQTLFSLNGNSIIGGSGEPLISMHFGLNTTGQPPKLGVTVKNFDGSQTMSYGMIPEWETPDTEWTLNFLQIQLKDPLDGNTTFDVAQMRSNPSSSNDADFSMQAYETNIGITENLFPGYSSLGDNDISGTEAEVGLAIGGDVTFDSAEPQGSPTNQWSTLRQSEWNNFTMWIMDDRMTESQVKGLFKQGPGCIGRMTHKQEFQVCNISAESLMRGSGVGPTDIHGNFTTPRVPHYDNLEDRFTYNNATQGLGSVLNEWSFGKFGNYTGS